MLGVKSYGEPPDWGDRKALVGSGYELLLDRAEGGAVNISLVVTISGSYCGGSLEKLSRESIWMCFTSSRPGEFRE